MYESHEREVGLEWELGCNCNCTHLVHACVLEALHLAKGATCALF